MREGQLSLAVETLEEVIRDDASLRIVFPTIAMCYVQMGERAKASTFIMEEMLSAARPTARWRTVWRRTLQWKGCVGSAALAAARDLSGQ